ncbi:cation transporter, partial [bacterium]
MHCKACELLTESELRDIPYVTKAKSNLDSNSVEITGDFGDKTPEALAEELSKVLEKHGYTLSVSGFDKLTTSKEIKNANWPEFKIAIPITLTFIVLFFTLQKIGLVNLVNTGSVSYGTAFV